MKTSVWFYLLWFFLAILSIRFVMFLTNCSMKILNHQNTSSITYQRCEISPWFFLKVMVDYGYITIMFLLPFFLAPNLNEKKLVIMGIVLTTVLVAAFTPYFFVRRKEFLFASDDCFEINFRSSYYGKICERILREQIRKIDFTRNKVIFYMKEGDHKSILQKALFAFRGYNVVIEKLENFKS